MQDLGIGYEKSGSSPNTQNVEEVLVRPASQHRKGVPFMVVSILYLRSVQ